jgi:nucleoside-diphosphate kinase
MLNPGVFMAGSQTLGIVKPDAVAGGKLGAILAHLEREGSRITAGRLVRLTRAQAEAFYELHRGRPFYDELVAFMTSGPCFPVLLEKPDAVAAFRTTIGATDPREAAAGTLRKLFAESKGRNAVHGSDSDENAAREIAFFFPESELAVLRGQD